MDTPENTRIIDSILQREERDREALALLLEQQREKAGHLLTLQVPMGGISSFVTSVDLKWVAGNVRFAADLPIFKGKPSAGVKRVKVDESTIAIIQQRRPDWKRQVGMAAYLAIRKHPKFPPLLLVGYQDWVYDDEVAEEWGVDNRAMQDSLAVTPMETKGSYCDLDFTRTKFYALDGQHRLMAIMGLHELLTKGVLCESKTGGEPTSSVITRDDLVELIREETNEDIGTIQNRLEGLMDERIGIEIMPAVSHGETYEEALRRLRQTFVDVNENAKKLTTGEISQLDETNGFRVIARNVMVSHNLLRGKTDDKQGQLAEASECYTTLVTLVDIAESYLGPKEGGVSDWKIPRLGKTNLGFMRPSEGDISEGQEVLNSYFDALSKLPSHRNFIEGTKAPQIRAEDGEDNILFRPMAQMALAVAVASLEKDREMTLTSIMDALTRQEKLGQLKLRDNKTPWFGVLCDPTKKTMRRQGAYQKLCNRLFFYLLGGGIPDEDEREKLRMLFAKARQIDADNEISIDLKGNQVKTDEVHLPNPWR